jgi:Tat protein secretion system quality control protein TatD with DNase activity
MAHHSQQHCAEIAFCSGIAADEVCDGGVIANIDDDLVLHETDHPIRAPCHDGPHVASRAGIPHDVAESDRLAARLAMMSVKFARQIIRIRAMVLSLSGQ